MKIIGIYIIFNRISKLVYVGSSFDVKTRFYRHLLRLRKKSHENKHLQYAFNKYGEESFKFTCIKIFYNISDKELRLQEQIYIDKINPKRLYNLCPVAGSTKGKKHTQETKDKIRVSVIKTLEHTDKNKCKSFVSFAGRTHTQEAKDKIRSSLKGKNVGKEFKNRQKPVLQIDISTGETINEFKTAKVAGEILDINHTHIYEVCSGAKSRKTAGGFIWKYKNSQGIV